MAGPNRWIERDASRAAPRLRLVLLPHAGAGAGAYRGWAQELPSDVELWRVQLPGREARLSEAPISDARELTRRLARALKAEGLGALPYELFGHSMGGLLAFELARELRRAGQPAPRRLVASACRAPHLPPGRALHALPDPELVAELARLGDARALEHPALRQLVLPALRADLAAHERYAFVEEPPLDVPIVACGGEDDSYVTRRDLVAWREHTNATFEATLLPGGHFYVRSARARLLQALVAPRVAAA